MDHSWHVVGVCITSCNKRGLEQPSVCGLLSFDQPVDLLPKSVKYLKSDPARSSLDHNEILDIHQQLEEERCSKCNHGYALDPSIYGVTWFYCCVGGRWKLLKYMN